MCAVLQAAAYNLLLEQRGRDVEGQDVRYYLAYAPTLPAAAGPTGECQYFTTFSHGDVASDNDREYSCTCFVKDDRRACASLSQGLPPNLPLDWPPDLPLPLLPPSVTAGSHCQPDQQQCSRSATPGGTTLHGHHIHLGSRTSVQRPASYVNYMYFQNCFSKPLQPRMPVAHQHGSATSRDCSPIREECCWDCGAPTVSPVALAVAGTDSLSIRERSSLECDVPTISPFSVDNICKYSLPTSNRAVLECGVDAVSVGDTHQEWSCSECGATRVSPAGGGDACQDVLSEALLDGTGGENSLKEQQVFLTDTSQEGDLSQRSSPLPGGTSSSSTHSSVSHTDQPVNKQADSNTENQCSPPHQSPPPPSLQSPPPPDIFHSGDTEPDVYHCVGGERDGYHCVGSQSDTGEQSEGACENSKSATQEVSADKEPHTSDSCKSSPGKRTIDIVTWSCLSHVDTSEDSDSLSLASSAYKYRATGQKGHHTGRGGFRSQRKPLDKNRPCPSKRSPPHPTLISFKERIQLTAEEKECWHPKNRYGFRPQLQRSRCPSQANCSPVSVYSIGGRQPLTSSSTSKQNHPLYKSINTELRNRIASYSAMFRQRPVSNPSSSYSAMFRQRPVSNPSSSYSAMFRQRPVSNPSSSYSATFKEMPVSHSSFDLNRRNPDVGHPNYDARYLNRDAAYLNRDAAHLNCDPSYLNQDPNYLNRDASYLNPDGSYLNFGVGVGGGSRRERQEQVLRSAPHLSPQIMRKKNAQQREADLTAHYCNSRTRRMVTGSRLSGTDQKWMSMGCPSEMVVDGKSCWLQYMGRKHLSNDYYAMCTRRPHDNQ
ncbi:hypothetical protein BaRGS_00037444 [Batillaria attramentaria]|uniref:Uncharacterized protein n=1 Tax=Batillaria attramentaria TaxID=370345 RepID=A0ABD0J8S0_9CAEN